MTCCRRAAEGNIVSAETLYKTACVCAGASLLAKRDEDLPGDLRAKQAEEYAVEALALLRWAVAGGFQDIQDLRSNPDLASLCGRRDFQELIRVVEAKRKVEHPRLRR